MTPIVLLLALVTACEGRSPVEPIPHQTPTDSSSLSGTVTMQSSTGYVPYVGARVSTEQFGLSYDTNADAGGYFRYNRKFSTGKAFVSIAAPIGYVSVEASILLFPGENPQWFVVRKGGR